MAEGGDFGNTGADAVIVFCFVGQETVRAILDSRFRVAEVSSALFSQGIQWAEAKQTVEVFAIGALVTGEIFTFLVLVEFVAHKLPSSSSCNKFAFALSLQFT